MPGKKESETLRREQILQAAFEVVTRDGLDQLTIRLVAAEAELSTGLVFFHFKSKEALRIALLDWLLDSLFEIWDAPDDLDPGERLLALIRLDLHDTYRADRAGIAKLALFFSYWTIAAHDPTIKERIQQAIERSRQVFLPDVQAFIDSEPTRFQGVTAAGLVTIIIGIAQGCAMQTLINGTRVDLEQLMRTIRALLIPHLDCQRE